MTLYRIKHYLTVDGRNDQYLHWLSCLRDRRAQVAVIRRINRIEQGNFGDHKFCRDGVWELRIDVGSGYRVYYAHAGLRVVLLLCAGDKGRQNGDIHRAVRYWQDWQRRNNDDKQTT
ncbi:type II toxin-antitoxin system RelE/ParE family toxin [Pollutimonas thiosulfatoxidans]|uniref:Addiction module protein n=1 Tax=Pollutimonas thiosulfatoxidans TaxID=2028345 RepID=A0A410GG78_9BURK|nr:type II toxin-antitoxin system RelE/ParE family toxin [Pollutimonas thiosulfatoxidans]NYT45529.1 type II toxin-antitoxin system RelE/ParE family toxin [Alcaligenaceae bacterium]QAA95313.1 addiction module protein [Pollutimonas thiosulfatoxidans]